MSERIYTSNEYKRLGERIRSNPLNISEERLSFDLLHIVPYYRMKHIQKQFKRKYGHANH